MQDKDKPSPLTDYGVEGSLLLLFSDIATKYCIRHYMTKCCVMKCLSHLVTQRLVTLCLYLWRINIIKKIYFDHQNKIVTKCCALHYLTKCLMTKCCVTKCFRSTKGDSKPQRTQFNGTSKQTTTNFRYLTARKKHSSWRLVEGNYSQTKYC